jgi:hypothetical protein
VLFWRVHWPDLPAFNQDNAWSRPWGSFGSNEKRERGYSAAESAYDLVHYFASRSPIGDDDPIVVFEGAVLSVGPDREPLVLPTRVLAWIRGADLDKGILEHENDPKRLMGLLRKLGRARRLR